MKQRKTMSGGLLTLGIAALFLVGFLLAVLFGTRSYLACQQAQQQHQEERALSASLSAGLRGFDRAGAITVRQTDDGPILELRDGDTGYAIRYYRADGLLWTDYAKIGVPLCPDDAQALGRTERFTAERLPSGLLVLTTDDGRVLYAPRSGGGAP